MKKIFTYVFFIFSFMALVSCEKKIEDPARTILEEVRKEYDNGNYNSAKNLIDSIKCKHPKAYKTLREAESLRHDILIKEKERDIVFFSSELQRLTTLRDSMSQYFDFHKNTKYQDLGVYSVNSQAISKNAFKNYLRATVKEDGEAVLTSFYRGKRIGYKSVKVVCGEIYVTAENPVYSWTGKEYGTYVERSDFKRGADGGMMDFIATSQGEVTVILSGPNGDFEYKLSNDDVRAITMIKDFADLLSSINECSEMLDASRYSLDFLLKGSERLKKDSLNSESGM